MDLNKIIYTENHYTNDKINILSFDGGGMRGIFSLCMLEYITKKLYGNADIDGTKKLLSNFQIICGTSTGSIIAIALATGKSINDIKKSYYELGNYIFSGNNYIYTPFRYLRYLKSGDFYNGDSLYNIIEKDHKDLYMTNIKKHKVFIPITDATTEEWIPYLSRSYEVKNSKTNGTSDLTVSKTIRASCAAPTYFSSVKEGDKLLVDGGCICNNPTELSIFESYHIYPDKTIGIILSIGTGIHNNKSNGSNNIVKVINGLINIASDAELIHGRVSDWCDINKINYFRFNPPNIGNIKLDETDINILQNGEENTINYMKYDELKIDTLKILFNAI